MSYWGPLQGSLKMGCAIACPEHLGWATRAAPEAQGQGASCKAAGKLASQPTNQGAASQLLDRCHDYSQVLQEAWTCTRNAL